MTRQVELKEALVSWPPLWGSGRGVAGNDAPVVELHNIITRTRLSSDGYLVLDLEGGTTTKVLVKEEYRVLLGRELQNIEGKTVGEAGSTRFDVA